jgi:hypothetical protein
VYFSTVLFELGLQKHAHTHTHTHTYTHTHTLHIHNPYTHMARVHTQPKHTNITHVCKTYMQCIYTACMHENAHGPWLHTQPHLHTWPMYTYSPGTLTLHTHTHMLSMNTHHQDFEHHYGQDRVTRAQKRISSCKEPGFPLDKLRRASWRRCWCS